MAKFCALLMLFVIVSVTLAEPARFANRSFNRNRFSARQEVEPTDDQAVNDAPYPAAGKPDGPTLELPNETAQPSNEYGPPSNEYGPPSSSDPNAPEQSDASALPDEPEAERLVFINGLNGGRISNVKRNRLAKLQAQPLQYQFIF